MIIYLAAGDVTWVQQLFQQFGSNENIVLYSSALDFAANDKINKGRFLKALGEPLLVPKMETMRFQLLKLDARIIDPFDQVPPEFFNNDVITSALLFRHLYVLLRSNVVMVDGNAPSFGEVGQQLLYAHLLDKYCVLVNDRVVPGPWLANHCNVVTSSQFAVQTLALALASFNLSTVTPEQKDKTS